MGVSVSAPVDEPGLLVGNVDIWPEKGTDCLGLEAFCLAFVAAASISAEDFGIFMVELA